MKSRIAVLIWILPILSLAGDADSLFHFFGASVSGFSGSGITYRFRKGNDFSLKMAGYVFYKDKNIDASDDEKSTVDFGLEYQKLIFNKQFILFNLCAGAELLNQKEPGYGYDKIDTRRLLIGLGFNIDVCTSFNPNYPDIVMFFGIGERYYRQRKIKWDDNKKLSDQNSKGLELTGSVGLGVEF